MDINECKELISKIAFDKKGKISPKSIKSNKLLYEYILNKTKFLKNASVSQRIWHIMNDVYEIVKCQECNEKRVTFSNYIKGYKRFCGQSCSTSNKQVQEKLKNTVLKKYGKEYYLQTDDYKIKSEKTCLEKYGVSSSSKSLEKRKLISDIKKSETEKQKQQRIKRHKETCLEKYGKEWYSQTDDFLQKCKLTWNKNLGVDHPSQSQEIKDKIIDKKFNTLIERIPDISKECEEQGLIIVNGLPKNIRERIEIKCEKGHIFFRSINALLYNKICPICNNTCSSNGERELFDFIEKYNNNILNNYRNLVSPLEIDIFLPDKNIAIEYDGLYWHSEINKTDKRYHINKTDRCNDKNIQLFHIFEDEWLYKNDIVKSVLLSKMGIFDNRIYARKCNIKLIDNVTKDNFLIDNHLQGTDKSSIRLGLFYDGELLSVMTFGKRQISSKSSFELQRFCNKKNVQVIGGASKLFKHFINNLWDKTEIVTYADRRWSNGKFYDKLGFEFSHISNINYWYIKNGQRYHRVNYQKHKLKEKLKNFNPELTEWENMQLNGFNRIWDCGNYVYKYK